MAFPQWHFEGVICCLLWLFLWLLNTCCEHSIIPTQLLDHSLPRKQVSPSTLHGSFPPPIPGTANSQSLLCFQPFTFWKTLECLSPPFLLSKVPLQAPSCPSSLHLPRGSAGTCTGGLGDFQDPFPTCRHVAMLRSGSIIIIRNRSSQVAL